MSVKINSFGRGNVKTVTREMMDALQVVGDKYGLDFGRKGCRFSDGDFRMTVTAKVCDRAEGVLTKAERDYNFHKDGENLPELGTTYFSNGIEQTIVGWNTRARKYPVSLKGSDGKSYKASPVSVRLNVR